MSEYRNFVSYMHIYTDGNKDENAGFVRAEVRGDMIKLFINISKIGFERNDTQCEVYLVKLNNMERIYLGNCVRVRGGLTFGGMLKNTYTDSLDDFAGIIVINSEIESVAYASLWTDEDVDIFAKKTDNTSYSENVEDNCEVLEDEACLDSQSIAEDDSMSPFLKEDRIDAFCDDYYYDLVEICPEDMEKLPENLVKLKNNSFILHGYYNYRHILLGRCQDSNRLFIGVPGTYHNTERYMAGMFGFKHFKCSHRSDIHIQGFGYWYMEASV